MTPQPPGPGPKGIGSFRAVPRLMPAPAFPRHCLWHDVTSPRHAWKRVRLHAWSTQDGAPVGIIEDLTTGQLRAAALEDLSFKDPRPDDDDA